MNQNASSTRLTEYRSERSGLPRYYLVTALVVVMILVLGGGAIYYRLVPETIFERTNQENLQFAEEIDSLAENAAVLQRISPDLVEQIEAEMADRPVLKVRIYGDERVRYSTSPSEIGDRFPVSTYWGYSNHEVNLEHYATVETATETLLERDVIVTRVRLGDYQDKAGLEIYTDVTDKRKEAFRLAPWIFGGIEAALAGILIFTLLRRT